MVGRVSAAREIYMAGHDEEGKRSLPVQASFTITCLDGKVGIASSMTGWSENHSADNLVSAFMIRLHTTTLKRRKIFLLSSNRESLE